MKNGYIALNYLKEIMQLIAWNHILQWIVRNHVEKKTQFIIFGSMCDAST